MPDSADKVRQKIEEPDAADLDDLFGGQRRAQLARHRVDRAGAALSAGNPWRALPRARAAVRHNA